MTVGELLGKTTSRELSEWIVYLNLDSWQEHFAKKAREQTTPDSAVVIQELFKGAK